MAETSDLRDGVTIAMCTFRRPAAFDALASLARMTGMAPGQVEMIVVDNDDHDGLRAQFEAAATAFPVPLRYIHAPARNISIARNAALDGADTRWLAFIDDDEIASPDWLPRLMARRNEAEAVIGQCIADYGPELPRWTARCDFHSNRIRGDATNAYTSNALLDLGFVRCHGLCFRPDLGRTGGEDTVFFRQVMEAGGRILYAPEAIVHEPVVPARATMTWVRRRMYRAGQTHGLLCREFDPSAYRTLWLTAGAKTLFSGAMAVATLPGSDASRRWFARATLHAGALRYRLGPTMLEEYG